MRQQASPYNHASSDSLSAHSQHASKKSDGAALVESGEILITRVGLMLPDDLPFEDWKDAGSKLFRIADSSAWCIGDWLSHGQESYGNRYRTAIAEAGLDYQTLRNYAWVARKFDLARRRERLSFQHHAEVASLPPEEQDRWLNLADQGRWSRNQLRKTIRSEVVNSDSSRNGNFMPRMAVAPADLARWQEAAAKTQSTLADWVVTALNQVASESLDLEESEDALESKKITSP